MPATAIKKTPDATSIKSYYEISYTYQDENGVTKTEIERLNHRTMARLKAFAEASATVIV